MTDKISHRKPDAKGFFINKNLDRFNVVPIESKKLDNDESYYSKLVFAHLNIN